MFRAKWRRGRREAPSSSSRGNEREGSGFPSDPVLVDYPSSSLPNTPATAPPVLTSNHHAPPPRPYQSYLLPRQLYEAAISNQPIQPYQEQQRFSQHGSQSLQDFTALPPSQSPLPMPYRQQQANKKQSLPVLPPVASVSPFHTPTRGSSTSYNRNLFRSAIPIETSSSSSIASSPTRFNLLEANETNMQLSINAHGQMSIYPPASASAPVLTDVVDGRSSTMQFPQHPLAGPTVQTTVSSVSTPRTVRPVSTISSLSNRGATGFVHNQTPSQLAVNRASVPSLSSRIELKTKKFFQKLKSPIKRFGSNTTSSPADTGKPSPDSSGAPKDKKKKKGSKAELKENSSPPPLAVPSLPGNEDSSGVDSRSSNPRKVDKGKSRSKDLAGNPDSHLSTSSISLPLHLLAVQHPNPQWQNLSSSRSPTLPYSNQPEGSTRKTGFEVPVRGEYQVDLLPARPQRSSATMLSPASPLPIPRAAHTSSSSIPNQWKRDSFRGTDYYRPGSSSARAEKNRRLSHMTVANHNTNDEVNGLPKGHVDRAEQSTQGVGEEEDHQSEHEESLDTSNYVKVRPSTSHGKLNNSPWQGEASNGSRAMRYRRSNLSISTEQRDQEREHTLEIISGGISDPMRTLSASPRPRMRRNALSPLSSHAQSPPGSRPSSQVSRLSLLPGPYLDKRYDEARQSPASPDGGIAKDPRPSPAPSVTQVAQDMEEDQMWRQGRVSMSSNTTSKPMRSASDTMFSSAGLTRSMVETSRPTSHDPGFVSPPPPDDLPLAKSLSPTTWIEVEASPTDPSLSETRTSYRRHVYESSLDPPVCAAQEEGRDLTDSQVAREGRSRRQMNNASPAVLPALHNNANIMSMDERSHWSTDSHTDTRSVSHGTVMTDEHHPAQTCHLGARSDGGTSQGHGEQTSLSPTLMSNNHRPLGADRETSDDVSFLLLGTSGQSTGTKILHQTATADDQRSSIVNTEDQRRTPLTRAQTSNDHVIRRRQRHPSMQVLSQPLATTSVLSEVIATRNGPSGVNPRRSLDDQLRETLHGHHDYRVTDETIVEQSSDDVELTQRIAPSISRKEARPRKSSQRVKNLANGHGDVVEGGGDE